MDVVYFMAEIQIIGVNFSPKKKKKEGGWNRIVEYQIIWEIKKKVANKQ